MGLRCWRGCGTTSRPAGGGGAPGRGSGTPSPPPGSARAPRGVSVAAELGFENAYALAVQRSRAEGWKVSTIGDLARISGGLAMGADYEFFARPEWSALQGAYGIDFRERRSMDPALMYQA